MEERSVVSERGRTYYWIEKCVRPERENLVFLPGLTADHRLFDGQIQHFSGRHTVLTWDAPAHREVKAPTRTFPTDIWRKSFKRSWTGKKSGRQC